MKRQNNASSGGFNNCSPYDGGLKTNMRLDGRPTGSGGFTLAELMVVVSVIGLLTAMAIPAYIKMQPQLRLRSAAREVGQALQAARMSAISNNVAMKVVFNTSDETFLIQRHASGSYCAAVYNTVRSIYDGEGWRPPADRWKDIDLYYAGGLIPYFDSLNCSSNDDGVVIFLPNGSATMVPELAESEQAIYLRNKDKPDQVYRVVVNGNTGTVKVQRKKLGGWV